MPLTVSMGHENTLVVMFLYVDTDDIRKHADKYQLEQRYASANTIAGIRSHHSFVPNSGDGDEHSGST